MNFSFKDRSEKIGRRLNLSNERFKELERRRNMEIEGFKTDIKMLRQKLKYVEKQLFRVRKLKIMFFINLELFLYI